MLVHRCMLIRRGVEQTTSAVPSEMSPKHAMVTHRLELPAELSPAR